MPLFIRSKIQISHIFAKHEKFILNNSLIFAFKKRFIDKITNFIVEKKIDFNSIFIEIKIKIKKQKIVFFFKKERTTQSILNIFKGQIEFK
jgi:hypothetical protein